MAETVWRIAVGPNGWVTSFWHDQPQVTGLVAEAHQWDTEAEAEACCDRWNRRRGYVKGKVVEGERTDPYQHGRP